MRPIRPFATLLTLLVPVAGYGQNAASGSPAPSGAATVSEGRLHFQRGLSLADESNYGAAMVEFQYAFRITHNPQLLYNIALAHQAVGHYVEALDAMRDYRAGALAVMDARRRAEIDATIARLESRIGRVLVPLNHPGLSVLVDGLRPIEDVVHEGMRVAVGRHRVTISAPGRITRDIDVDVPSSVTVPIDEPLRPVQSSIAIDSNVPDAEVSIDGRVVATTPVASPIAVDEGRHSVAVRRPGYEPFSTTVTAIGTGARVTAELPWQSPLPAEEASHLRIRASEPDARVLLDGRPVAIDGSDAIPPGPHALRVELPNFIPVEREVVLPAGGSIRVEAVLHPTQGHLQHLRAQRSSAVRTALLGGGIALLNSAATFVLIPFAALPSSNPGESERSSAATLSIALVTVPGAITGVAMGISGLVHYLRTPSVLRRERASRVMFGAWPGGGAVQVSF